MSSVSEASRRSTDDILEHVMRDAGNGDPERVKNAGRKMHFDPFVSAEAERQPKADGPAIKIIAKEFAGKALSYGLSHSFDSAIAKTAEQAALNRILRTAHGAIEAAGFVVLEAALMYEGAKAKTEGDRQMAYGASDAGVVGLAQALAFDDGFKANVTKAHPGATNAGVKLKTELEKSENKGELLALQLRADKGLVDAAPLVRGAVTNLAAEVRAGRRMLDDAKANGEPGAIEHAKEVYAQVLARAANQMLKAIAPLMAKAHDDAAYGLGVQYAVDLAMRDALSGGTGKKLDDATGKANGRLAEITPTTIVVHG